MSLRRVEKKQMIGGNNKDTSEAHTSAKLLLLTFSKNVFMKLRKITSY